MEYATNNQWKQIEKFIIDLQKTCKKLKVTKLENQELKKQYSGFLSLI